MSIVFKVVPVTNIGAEVNPFITENYLETLRVCEKKSFYRDGRYLYFDFFIAGSDKLFRTTKPDKLALEEEIAKNSKPYHIYVGDLTLLEVYAESDEEALDLARKFADSKRATTAHSLY